MLMLLTLVTEVLSAFHSDVLTVLSKMHLCLCLLCVTVAHPLYCSIQRDASLYLPLCITLSHSPLACRDGSVLKIGPAQMKKALQYSQTPG